MVRTTIDAPDEVIERLRHVAKERGVSLDVVIREALEEKAGFVQPWPRSVGIIDSGRTDISIRAGEERPVPRSLR